MSVYTQSQLDAARAALASGAKSYRYTDRTGAQQEAELRPYDEMISLIAMMAADINGPTSNRTVVSTSKGTSP